jgi:hypothetical protein
VQSFGLSRYHAITAHEQTPQSVETRETSRAIIDFSAGSTTNRAIRE